MIIVCVHIHADDTTEYSKTDIIWAIFNFLQQYKCDIIYIAGDFNFTIYPEDRCDLMTGMHTAKRCELSALWDRLFENYDELYQEAHTRFPGGNWDGKSSSRIDRIYRIAILEAYCLFDIKVTTFLPTVDNYVSDHNAVLSDVAFQDEGPKITRIPHHIAKTELFQKLLDQELQDAELSNCAFARLTEVKNIMKQVNKQVLEIRRNRGAVCAKERIHWAIKALRAHYLRQDLKFEEAINAAPQLKLDNGDAKVPADPNHLAHIRRVLKLSLDQDDEETRRENEEMKNMPEV